MFRDRSCEGRLDEGRAHPLQKAGVQRPAVGEERPRGQRYQPRHSGLKIIAQRPKHMLHCLGCVGHQGELKARLGRGLPVRPDTLREACADSGVGAGNKLHRWVALTADTAVGQPQPKVRTLSPFDAMRTLASAWGVFRTPEVARKAHSSSRHPHPEENFRRNPEALL